MNKLVLIIPYFGKFPNYFQLFLNSCRVNKDICDWIIYTDDNSKYNIPLNVSINYCSFNDIQRKIRKKISAKTCIDNPYKLCDYRPAYGIIFEEEIKEYKFWGHCDVDVIFGKFSRFFNEDMLKNDRIFRLGHLCFYKNTFENNRRFMLPVNGYYRYREVFSTSRNCIFDEVNEYGTISIEDIWEHYNFSNYNNDYAIANTYYKSNTIRLLYQKEGCVYEKEKRRRAIFFWHRGELLRMYVEGGKLVTNEFLYIHLMRRPMKQTCDNNCELFKIIPNCFDSINCLPVNIGEFNRIKWRTLNLQYFHTRYINLKSKIRKRFKSND